MAERPASRPPLWKISLVPRGLRPGGIRLKNKERRKIHSHRCEKNNIKAICRTKAIVNVCERALQSLTKCFKSTFYCIENVYTPLHRKCTKHVGTLNWYSCLCENMPIDNLQNVQWVCGSVYNIMSQHCMQTNVNLAHLLTEEYKRSLVLVMSKNCLYFNTILVYFRAGHFSWAGHITCWGPMSVWSQALWVWVQWIKLNLFGVINIWNKM